jgi:hypothetical protein
MRVAVMAAGAVGGYFGGRMAAAGHDVVFIARGAHGDTVRRDGLKIESALGDLHLKNVNVTDDPKRQTVSIDSLGVSREHGHRHRPAGGNCYCSSLPKGSGLCLPCYTRWLAGRRS